MKKIVFICFVLGLTALVSCQKELTADNAGSGNNPTTPVDTNYFVRFKLDGVQQEYKTGVIAVKLSFPAPLNIKSLTVQGRPGSANQPSVAVDVRDAADIVVNQTYTEAIVSGTASSLVYFDAAGEPFSSVLAAPSGFECRFSEITATYVRGTFKGKLKGLTGLNKEITEGQFYARIL